jgi:hypothetical protein
VEHWINLRSRLFSPVLATQSLLLSLVLLASLSSFGATPFSVQVTVTDNKNVAVPGATIQASSNGQPLATANTDEKGKATLAVSIPKVDLTINKDGYVTTQTSLTLQTGEDHAQIEIVLPQSALSKQEVEVSATASSPTAETSSTSTDVAVTQAKQTASRPATVIDTLPLVPGVIRAPDGGVQVAGYGQTHSALLVNSVNVTDPATGDFGLGVPIDSVQSISVSEMPYLAQYGKFTAGVIAADTRRGGEKWEYSLNDPFPDFRIRSGHLEGVRDASPRLNFSGPVIPNKVYFVEGGEYLLYKREVYTLPYGSNETKSEAFNSFSQMDWIVSPHQTLTASFHFAPQSLDYVGLNYFNQQPVTPNATFHETTPTILDRLQIGEGILQSTFAITQVSSRIDPQGLADMVLAPGGNTGNYYNQQDRRATRYQWLENWAPKALHFHGDHLLQIGAVVARAENEGAFHPHQALIKDANGNLLQSIDFTGQGSFDLSDTEPAFYIQDHWNVTSRFGIDFGIRVESQSITSTWRSAPRGGFVWSPSRTGNTVIRGGMGVFYDSVPLDVYAFRSYPQQVVTDFDPTTGAITDGPRQYYNVMAQVPAQGGFDFVHRGANTGNFAPYSLAGNIEVEHSFNHLVLLRVKYLQSTAQDMITISPDPFGRVGALVLGSTGEARTRQLELTARIGSKASRQFFFSYVRQHAQGNVTDANSYLGNFPYPVARQNLVASLPGEIPNRFLLWGSYQIGKTWTVSPKIELRNGFPYYPTDVYQQYVAGLPYQSRYPRYFSADLRVSKDIKVSAKHAVRLSVNVFNLTNHFNPFEVHGNIADPMYGNFFGNYDRKFTADFDFLY